MSACLKPIRAHFPPTKFNLRSYSLVKVEHKAKPLPFASGV